MNECFVFLKLGYDHKVRVCNLCYMYRLNPFEPPSRDSNSAAGETMANYGEEHSSVDGNGEDHLHLDNDQDQQPTSSQSIQNRRAQGRLNRRSFRQHQSQTVNVATANPAESDEETAHSSATDSEGFLTLPGSLSPDSATFLVQQAPTNTSTNSTTLQQHLHVARLI